MLKMYMQLILTLGSFFGFVLSALWLTMTYIYATEILEDRGAVPLYNWPLIYSALTFLVICIVAFVCSVLWVRRSKAEEREKMSRYRRLAGR